MGNKWWKTPVIYLDFNFMSFIQKTVQLVKREKLYAFLLLFILSAWGFSLVWSRISSNPAPDRSLEQSVQELDKIIARHTKDPSYLESRFQKDPTLGLVARASSSALTVAILLGICLNIMLIQRIRSGRPWLEAAQETLRARWGIREVVKVMILFSFFAICLDLFLFMLEPWLPENFKSNFLILFHTTVTDVLAIGFIGYFIQKVRGNPFHAFGLHHKLNWFREMGVGLAAYLAVLPSFLIIMILLAVFSNLIHYEPPPHPLIGIFVEEETRAPWLVFYSLFLACVLGPIVEEIFFRGFLYPALRKKLGVSLGICATALFFAWIHENLFALLPIFLLGSVLAYLYEKRRNLIPCITLHVVHNSVFIFYFFLIKALLVDHPVTP
ncbi:MAG: CPBP family intramembrane metalloprotease [Candidatus Omnitrophica bacterium]|nr:CPBP family intramembrane metalloprotease [Candidatus Omnitrophota bacterium]